MRRLLSIAVTLLLVSCAPAVTTIPTPSAEAATTAAPPTEPPSLASPLATPTASVAVAPTEAPALGERLASAQADFDCDGRADTLQFFALSGARGDANRLARLVLATGAIHDLALVANVGGSPLIGTTDVNGDGCDDAIVTLDRGASTISTTFVVYDGNELRQVEEDGKPATFLFGGSVRHGNAIECRRTKDAAELVVRAASDYTSDFQWDAVEDVHHWSSKSQLLLWSTTRSVIAVTVRYAMPADSDRYWGLSCGNVKL